jgi:hypothetical protein
MELIKPLYIILIQLHQKIEEIHKTRCRRMAKPFETAGLKMLHRKDPPTKEEDPDFSPEDMRVTRTPSITSEPVPDQRLPFNCTTITAYPLRNGAANPSARTLNTSDEEIGR